MPNLGDGCVPLVLEGDRVGEKLFVRAFRYANTGGLALELVDADGEILQEISVEARRFDVGRDEAYVEDPHFIEALLRTGHFARRRRGPRPEYGAVLVIEPALARAA